jgi:hypothetical protein
MDKELAQLEEWGVDLINNYEKELQRTDPKSSMHKRIKRFSGELVANPEAYGELLELGRSQGMTGPELVNAIRRIEQGLLDEAGKGKAPSRKQMLSDVIHHFYAQRTGGDTLRRLGQADRQQARAALRDEFGRWGNVPENLRSLFRAGHLNNDVLKGIEAEALAEIGVTSPGQLAIPKAHTTKGKAVTGDIVGATTAQEAIEGMRPQFQIQGRETQAAIDVTQPLMEDLDKLAGSTYTTDMSDAELEVRRKVLAAKPEEVKAAIKTRLAPYIVGDRGTLKLFGGVPFGEQIVETVTKNPAGAAVGALTAVDTESVKLAREGKYGEAAVQAGTGAAVGAVVEQALKRVAPTAMRIMPQAGKLVLGSVAAPLAAGAAGFQALDVITTAATGKTLQETGQAAEQTKEELRQQGMSEAQLRRRFRTRR